MGKNNRGCEFGFGAKSKIRIQQNVDHLVGKTCKKEEKEKKSFFIFHVKVRNCLSGHAQKYLGKQSNIQTLFFELKTIDMPKI